MRDVCVVRPSPHSRFAVSGTPRYIQINYIPSSSFLVAACCLLTERAWFVVTSVITVPSRDSRERERERLYNRKALETIMLKGLFWSKGSDLRLDIF